MLASSTNVCASLSANSNRVWCPLRPTTKRPRSAPSAEGADLGRLVVGRKGHQTRFELAESDAQTFVDEANIAPLQCTESVDDCSGAEEAPARYHGGSKPRV